MRSFRVLSALFLLGVAVRADAAIGVSELTSSFSNSDATSYATASVTPASGAAVLVVVMNFRGTPTVPSLSGASISNVDCTVTTTIATTTRLSICRALSTGSAGAITIDFSGATQSNCLWKVLEVTGADVTSNGNTLVIQSSTGTDATTTTAAGAGTLSAFASGSAVVAAFGSTSAANTFAVEGGTWVESGSEVSSSSPNSTLGAEWNLSADTTPTGTWGTSTSTRGLAVELKAAAGGGGSVRCCGGGLKGVLP